MLLLFSLIDFFAFKERITVVIAAGVVGMKKKGILLLSLCYWSSVWLPKEQVQTSFCYLSENWLNSL